MPERQDEAEMLDRIIGSSWQWTEQHFRALLPLGSASRLRKMEKHRKI